MFERRHEGSAGAAPSSGTYSLGVLLLVALASIVATLIVVSPAEAHVPVCGVNSVGGRVQCHTGIFDNQLHTRATSSSGYCPSDFYRIGSVSGFDDIFAGAVCDNATRNVSNFFCVGCRPTTISIDNRYPVQSLAQYVAWHDN